LGVELSYRLFKSSLFLQERPSPLDNVINGKAELLHHHISRRGGAESLDSDNVPAVTYITVPAERQGGLHREPGSNRRRQN
jgi:hypothetical protein